MSRILLKLSGEALADSARHYDDAVILGIAEQVKTLLEKKYEIGIVIGGGNYWRGRTSENIDRTKADQIGMLATVMNCIYVSELFRSTGIQTRIFTPFMCSSFTELFSKDEVVKSMKAIDGVYDSDPKKNPNAKKYDTISIDDVIAGNLQVVDMTASILARDNKMPMYVFDLTEENSILNAVCGKFNGTAVTV